MTTHEIPNPGRRSLCIAVLAALLACLPACRAHAGADDPRFGDSSWVAPGLFAGDDPGTEGARVASPDHERTWETALRLPFRTVFFPLRVVARGAEWAIDRYGDAFVRPGPRKHGIEVAPVFDVGAIDDISAGPDFTWVGFPAGDARLDLHATLSTLDRRKAEVSEVVGEHRPVGFQLRAAYDYRPNTRYYGIGNDASATLGSYYLMEQTSVQGMLLLGASPLRQLRVHGGYQDMAPRRGANGTPLLENVFAPADVPYYHQATHELHVGLGGDLAALDDGSDPSAGVHGIADWQRAFGVRASDPTYNQWQLEGRGYLPVFSRRRVLAVRAVYAGVDPAGGTATIPFYDLVQSDGPLQFAGFSSHRFRDRQLMLARVEYRWVIWHTMSALALYEWGEVAPRFGAFAVAAAHKSYGLGIRMGTGDGTTVRAELADSKDGLEAVLQTGVGF